MGQAYCPFRPAIILQIVNFMPLAKRHLGGDDFCISDTERPIPVAVIAASMLIMLVEATSSDALPSCITKTEARQHFGAVHIYWLGADHCWDASPTSQRNQIQAGRSCVSSSVIGTVIRSFLRCTVQDGEDLARFVGTHHFFYFMFSEGRSVR
jgi:hypothetical protein